jgi:erythromycin esterase-like protein/predicted phosphoribosyltransferase
MGESVRGRPSSGEKTMPPQRLFRDRRDAGRILARLLEGRRLGPEIVVLGLPRGGVPVAYEVADALGVPLDVFVVRKLGIPGHEEVAMGAIASGGVLVLDDDVVRGLRISPEEVRRVAEREARELLRREQSYRQGPMVDVTGKTVILVDDGLATGASMRAAILALRRLHPARIVVAVPAAPASTCEELAAQVDDVICATTPTPFLAVGHSYWSFEQTSDEEVRALLREAAGATDLGTGTPERSKVEAIRSDARPVSDGVPDDDALLELVGDARFVLIGEASHGTHEFYEARARITELLISRLGFCAVAAEADWPDAYQVNRFVRGRGADANAEEALRGFERFPTWMWRNAVVVDFVRWLREHNDRIGDDRSKAGFFGLDLYSLHRSMHEIVTYLDRIDPVAAARARARFSCFDHHSGDDGQSYGYAAAYGAGESCQREVVEQLVDLQQHAWEYARRDGLIAEDELFDAEQNAHTVRTAEEYYRTMFAGRVSSWNLRDRHMAHTLDALAVHLGRQRGVPARIVVWAHNSHVGDARATEVGTIGEVTLGQLVREQHPEDCRLLGFTTYTGTVTAASDWGGPPERKRVRPALPDSAEELFHEVGEEGFMVRLRGSADSARVLQTPRLERAIGVIYRPETERQSHYFRARLSDQFDAVIHIDETRAVEPLERTARWEDGEVPETYPFAV